MTTGEKPTVLCDRPPSGWWCSRPRGHKGPCPTRRVHTDWQPAFQLSQQQREAIEAWHKKHDQEKHASTPEKPRYSGAIGGAYTWCFTPTSVGTVVMVKCSCGEELDVSDYDNW